MQTGIRTCGGTLVLALAIIFGFSLSCNAPVNPLEDPENARVILTTETKSKSDSELQFHVNEQITVQGELRVRNLMDSVQLLVVYPAGNDTSVDTTLRSAELQAEHSFSFLFEEPCRVTLAAVVFRSNNDRYDTSLELRITEEPGAHQPPSLDVGLKRPYAAPSLPCSATVNVGNEEPWQEVSLACESPADNFTVSGDTLFVWTPRPEDTDSSVEITLTAADNGVPPKSVSVTREVAVIADNAVPPVPENVRIAGRPASLAHVVWDPNPLADGYVVFRSETGGEGTWEETPVGSPEFFDSTETPHFYTVSAVNYFGRSAPSEKIWGADAVHYAHRVFFADSSSTVDEAVGTHALSVRVNRPA
jgi:hypothetical protein